jgi:integrase
MSVYCKTRADNSKAWYYDFSYNKQRYRGVAGKTKSQAERVLGKVRDQVISGRFELTQGVKNPKIQDFAKVFLRRRKSKRSIKRDKLSVRTLLRYFKGNHLSEIESHHIEDYIERRGEDGVANSTINRELACLKRMFNLAIEWNEARKNPVIGVEFLEEPDARNRFLSILEIDLLLNSAPNHLRNILFTAINTGMRRGEILNLTWDRVHITGVIHPHIMVSKETAKGKKSRAVPLNDGMISLLSKIRSDQVGSEYVFLGTHGKNLTRIDKPFKNTLKRTGITDFRFHDTRHTFSSHYLMNGGEFYRSKKS